METCHGRDKQRRMTLSVLPTAAALRPYFYCRDPSSTVSLACTVTLSELFGVVKDTYYYVLVMQSYTPLWVAGHNYAVSRQGACGVSTYRFWGSSAFGMFDDIILTTLHGWRSPSFISLCEFLPSLLSRQLTPANSFAWRRCE